MRARRVLEAYRRRGADPPFGDPRGHHGGAMEGYYWRLLDRSGLVVVTLCGVVGDGGPGLVALATSEDGLIFSGETPPPRADPRTLGLSVPGAFRASAGSLEARAGDGVLRLEARGGAWPRRMFGGLGPAHAVPGLSQYWHPHTLAADAAGTLTLGGVTRPLRGVLYGEKNWGPAFPRRWWWAEAHDAATTVTLAGGEVRLGALALEATAVVVRHGRRVWRIGLPTGVVRTRTDGGRWRVRGRSGGLTVEVEARPGDGAPVPLPVPRTVPGAPLGAVLQHLDGELRVRLARGRTVLVDRVLPHAGMEAGTLRV